MTQSLHFKYMNQISERAKRLDLSDKLINEKELVIITHLDSSCDKICELYDTSLPHKFTIALIFTFNNILWTFANYCANNKQYIRLS